MSYKRTGLFIYQNTIYTTGEYLNNISTVHAPMTCTFNWSAVLWLIKRDIEISGFFLISFLQNEWRKPQYAVKILFYVACMLGSVGKENCLGFSHTLHLQKTCFLGKSRVKQPFEHASKSLPKGRFTQICTKTFPSLELTSALSLNVTTSSEHFIMHHLLI